MTDISTAAVPTARAARYGKQLVSHLGRNAASSWDDESGCGTLELKGRDGTGPTAHVCFTSTPESLLIEIRADAEHQPSYEKVVGEHLIRFGAKDELTVQWSRDGGTNGADRA